MDNPTQTPMEREQYALKRLVKVVNEFPFASPQAALAQCVVQNAVIQALCNALEAVVTPLLSDPDAIAKAKYQAFWNAADQLKALSQKLSEAAPRIQVAGSINGDGRH